MGEMVGGTRALVGGARGSGDLRKRDRVVPWGSRATDSRCCPRPLLGLAVGARTLLTATSWTCASWFSEPPSAAVAA